jgi:hypothetical protein
MDYTLNVSELSTVVERSVPDQAFFGLQGEKLHVCLYGRMYFIRRFGQRSAPKHRPTMPAAISLPQDQRKAGDS